MRDDIKFIVFGWFEWKKAKEEGLLQAYTLDGDKFDISFSVFRKRKRLVRSIGNFFFIDQYIMDMVILLIKIKNNSISSMQIAGEFDWNRFKNLILREKEYK